MKPEGLENRSKREKAKDWAVGIGTFILLNLAFAAMVAVVK